MARDRKRAKQRQRRRSSERQPARVAGRRDVEPSGDPQLRGPLETPGPLDAPDPLEDASAEVEIAEASLVDPPVASLEADEMPADEGDGQADEPLAQRPRDTDGDGAGHPPSSGGASGDAGASGADLPREGSRFGNFLRACVAELRRVQWPDRRQVTQATGVVIGFVIIAGAYLGVLDAIFSRLVNAVL